MHCVTCRCAAEVSPSAAAVPSTVILTSPTNAAAAQPMIVEYRFPNVAAAVQRIRDRRAQR